MRNFGKAELEALKRDVDLVELVRSHGVDLRKSGRSFLGLCPFHDDHNPSFSVDPKTNLWHCFGACGSNGKRGGDAISFLRLKEGLSFQEALDRLVPGNGSGNGSSGPKSPPKTPASEREKGDPQTPSEGPIAIGGGDRARLLDAVATHYEAALSRSPRAQSYLKKRGLLVPEVLRAARVGYADGSVLDAIAAKGEQREQLIALGVLTEDGHEAMTGMVTVPLLDGKSGAVVQLYGRAIAGRRHHYLKGELHGLVNGAAAATSEDLVVVESVIDALSLLVLGFRNVVPIYGTNGWKADHDRLLEGSAVKRVTLLLDSDDAGKGAAELLGEKLARRGLLVRIAKLPDHKDPNDALVAGVTPEEFREVLGQAVSVAGAPAQSPAPQLSDAEATARYEVDEVPGGFRLTVGPRRYLARGVRGGAYERLQVNLKLEDGFGVHVDVLDLYNARARTGFVRRVARDFGFDGQAIERELGFVAEVAEAEIAKKSEEELRGDVRPAPPEVGEEAKVAALGLLRDPRLLERTTDLMTRLGYVGEETNKALGALIVVSRKLDDPLSALVLSQSGAGKSGLTEVLERLTPPEDVVLYSRLTTNALYYMPKDFLARKVVVIEERSGSEEADYSLRTLQSRKKLVLGVPIKDPRTGKMTTRTIEVDGPAVFLQTSTAMEINYENSTRCFELHLDESVEQTRRIHAHQRRLRTLDGQLEAVASLAMLELHWNAQRLLRPVRVHMPFADVITFPDHWLRTRRDQVRFLSLIEASAFLHQYQRPAPKGAEPDTAVEATVEDYAVAYELAREVLGSTLTDVKKPARDLLIWMRTIATEKAKESKTAPERVTLTRRELRERTGLPDLQVWRLLRHLVELEWVEQVTGSTGRTATYRLAGAAPADRSPLAGLLTPAALRQRLPARS